MTEVPNAIDTQEFDYLFIGHSQLPIAGHGLLTVIDISNDEIISVFFGEKLSDHLANLRASNVQNNCFSAWRKAVSWIARNPKASPINFL